MADDLLDSAQKQINDAAQTAGTPPPAEPAPEPVIPPAAPPANEPPPAETPVSETPITVPPPPEEPTPVQKSKPKTGLIAGLLLLFATLPLTVYYVQQQRQLADIRSSAAPPPVESCSGCAGNGTAWKVVRGECKKVEDKSCKPETPPPGTPDCSGSSAGGCQGKKPGTACGNGGQCVRGDNDQCSCQGQTKDTPKPTATPAPQCSNLKIYKGGSVVTPSTLVPGDNVVLAVKGTGAAKGRIRVNGGTFTETTSKNASDEYTVDFTIPTGVTNFTVEAEVFIDGDWR